MSKRWRVRFERFHRDGIHADHGIATAEVGGAMRGPVTLDFWKILGGRPQSTWCAQATPGQCRKLAAILVKAANETEAKHD